MVYILWDLSGKYGFQWNDRWYEHVPDNVLENEDYKMLWDFSIRTDHEIEARRLDLLVIDQKKEQLQHYRQLWTMEDGRVRAKEDEYWEKNQNLTREIQKMWGVRTMMSKGP